MPVVGCPKCKKKFKLSNEMLGKTVKCSNCETAFKTAGQAKAPAGSKPKSAGAPKQNKKRAAKKPSAATGGPTQASKSSLKDVGLSGPINPQMDLFAQPIPSKRGPDPLGNFSLEDPGFGNVDLDVDDEDEEDSTPDDKKHLFMNPALKSAAPTSRNKKAKRLSGKPSGFVGIKILGGAVTAFGIVGILSCLVAVIATVLNVIQANSDFELFANIKYFMVMAFMISIIAAVITQLTSLAFWPLAHANTSTLGATGQKFSVLWIIGSWFVPFMNLIWVPQGITEIVKASKRPDGKRWVKLKETVWESPTFVIANLVAPICFYITYGFAAKMPGISGLWIRTIAMVLGSLLVGLALFCIVSLIRKITKDQYGHFES